VNFEIAPLRALRFDVDRLAAGEGPGGGRGLNAVAAPPYDIIAQKEHRALLDRSPFNIVRLTLGDRPGETADYHQRAALLERWKREGVLREDPSEALFVYGADYQVPGGGPRASFRGLLALGSLHEFSAGVVLPHERTFPKVVDDRYRLLEATRTHLELIFLLYADRKGEIDAVLAAASAGRPEGSVEARPGEVHSLWPIRQRKDIDRLRGLLRLQKPIIADGHHRYTTALRYLQSHRDDPAKSRGAGWQPMVLGNLFGQGLTILGTHRLVALGGRAAEGLRILEKNLAPAKDEASADFVVETREAVKKLAIPQAMRAARKGVARTSYAILHDVVLGEWLKPLLGASPGASPGTAGDPHAGEPIKYFKEGTGEREALRSGEGDILVRMKPVDRQEFQEVVEGGEVFPHKTTFFYPKLWSGMALWTMAAPDS
jgi:uncharacterized protein (DUF1015 family)